MGTAEKIVALATAGVAVMFFFDFLSAMHEVRKYHNLHKDSADLGMFNSAKRWKRYRNDYLMVATFNLIMVAGFSWSLYCFLKDML